MTPNPAGLGIIFLMKITDRLIGDHKTFRKMGAEIEEIMRGAPAERDQKRLVRIVELFKDHLVLHAWFEDNFYYPAVEAAIGKEVSTLLTPTYMKHLEHEHKTIDGYVDRLEEEVKQQPPAFGWPQTFALFSHGLKGHMKREEEELFPESERLLGAAQLEKLSDEMEKRRSGAPRIRIHSSS